MKSYQQIRREFWQLKARQAIDSEGRKFPEILCAGKDFARVDPLEASALVRLRDFKIDEKF